MACRDCRRVERSASNWWPSPSACASWSPIHRSRQPERRASRVPAMRSAASPIASVMPSVRGRAWPRRGTKATIAANSTCRCHEDAAPVKVVIADDEPLARERLRMLLAALPGIELVAEAGDGRGALHACAEHDADVVLLDIAMPGIDGLEAARHLAAFEPRPA